MALFSPRLPHVLTRADLSKLLTLTYAREIGASEELAEERLIRALKNEEICDRIYEGVSSALLMIQGSRSVDDVIDVLSKTVPKWLYRMKAAPASPAISAVAVYFNIELGLASQGMSETLDSDKGRKILDQGFRALGEFLVKIVKFPKGK